MIVHFGVHFETEWGDEDEDAFVVTVVSIAKDAAVDLETEDKETQGGDVVDVANDDILAAHVDGDDALSRDGSLDIVGESDVLVVDTMVGDDSLVGVP